MESDVLNEKVERKSKRVAAAFGLQRWEEVEVETEEVRRVRFCGHVAPGIPLECQIGATSQCWDYIVLAVGHKDIYEVFQNAAIWNCTIIDERHNELMARGLYRLGFEEEGVWREMGVTLTAHEKLELRLTLPREFWPQQWIDAEEAR